MGRLVIVAVLLFTFVLESSMAGRPLYIQSMPRGDVPPSCASGCTNYNSPDGSTGCSCPAGSINVAGASIGHQNFHGVPFGVIKYTRVDQYS
ncbi:hypothetical protein SUGI_0375000 [Cryptomeria japonica]|nr:hypothetical protein SUGI_0375000 [Cryptomeria japonica]